MMGVFSQILLLCLVLYGLLCWASSSNLTQEVEEQIYILQNIIQELHHKSYEIPWFLRWLPGIKWFFQTPPPLHLEPDQSDAFSGWLVVGPMVTHYRKVSYLYDLTNILNSLLVQPSLEWKEVHARLWFKLWVVVLSKLGYLAIAGYFFKKLLWKAVSTAFSLLAWEYMQRLKTRVFGCPHDPAGKFSIRYLTHQLLFEGVDLITHKFDEKTKPECLRKSFYGEVFKLPWASYPHEFPLCIKVVK